MRNDSFFTQETLWLSIWYILLFGMIKIKISFHWNNKWIHRNYDLVLMIASNRYIILNAVIFAFHCCSCNVALSFNDNNKNMNNWDKSSSLLFMWRGDRPAIPMPHNDSVVALTPSLHIIRNHFSVFPFVILLTCHGCVNNIHRWPSTKYVYTPIAGWNLN